MLGAAAGSRLSFKNKHIVSKIIHTPIVYRAGNWAGCRPGRARSRRGPGRASQELHSYQKQPAAEQTAGKHTPQSTFFFFFCAIELLKVKRSSFDHQPLLLFSISICCCNEHTYQQQMIIPEFQTRVELHHHCQPLSLIAYCIDFCFKYRRSLIIPFT